MRERRRPHPRWRGRQPAVRWRLQDVSLRARGERDAFETEHTHFWADTTDGVRLAGTMLGPRRETAVVLVHGFMGYRTKRPWRRLAEGLAQRFTVFAFDLRGHGQSTGLCSGGQHESLDVQAVVDHARARGFEQIVTVGGSLGGIAVLNHAATSRDVDGVVAISTPAVWGGEEQTKMVRRMTWLFVSPLGRSVASRIMGTRIGTDWGNPAPPADIVEKISPTPLLLIHGEDDHFFPPTDARLLFERAREPKKLILVERFGHAEDGFTLEFAERLGLEIADLLGARDQP